MIEPAERFLSTLARSPRTVETYRAALKFYFGVAGDVLSDAAYEKFLAALKDFSPSTKRVRVSAVMGMYAFAEIGGLKHRKQLNKHYLNRQKPKAINFDREAVERVIVYCDTLRADLLGLRDRAFVLTLAGTGLRISELVGLTRGEIDWRNERVMITGKGDKMAVVRIAHPAILALKEYLDARAKMDGGSGKSLKSLPLFAHHGKHSKETKIRAMSVKGMWKSLKGDPEQGIPGRIAEAGVDRSAVRIHDFRHYFVTMAYLSKRDLKFAQVLARHESIGTTNRYTHFGDDEVDKMFDETFNRR